MSKFRSFKKIPLVQRVYNAINPPMGMILMLHRVVELRSEIKENRLLEITPQFLEQSILRYQSKGYHFVGIEEAYSIQTGKEKNHPYICFTFDDGYRDNLELAFPIFEKYKVPFTIYIATDFPDGNTNLWWYTVDEWMKVNNRLILPDGQMLSTKSYADKNTAFLHISDIIKTLSKEELKQYMHAIAKQNALSLKMQPVAEVLSWDEIRQLSNTGLCSFGSHGVSHIPLTLLDEASLRYEFVESKKRIEQQIGKPVLHFAYPYGEFNATVADMAKACGYLSAVKVDGGMQRIHQNPFYFKRQGLIEKDALQ